MDCSLLLELNDRSSSSTLGYCIFWIKRDLKTSVHCGKSFQIVLVKKHLKKYYFSMVAILQKEVRLIFKNISLVAYPLLKALIKTHLMCRVTQYSCSVVKVCISCGFLHIIIMNRGKTDYSHALFFLISSKRIKWKPLSLISHTRLPLLPPSFFHYTLLYTFSILNSFY